jgi:hypothetical protein
MNPDEFDSEFWKKGYVIRYTIKQDDLTEFLEQLYDMQQEYLEAAIEASQYKDAKEIINHVRSL